MKSLKSLLLTSAILGGIGLASIFGSREARGLDVDVFQSKERTFIGRGINFDSIVSGRTTPVAGSTTSTLSYNWEITPVGEDEPIFTSTLKDPTYIPQTSPDNDPTTYGVLLTVTEAVETTGSTVYNTAESTGSFYVHQTPELPERRTPQDILKNDNAIEGIDYRVKNVSVGESNVRNAINEEAGTTDTLIVYTGKGTTTFIDPFIITRPRTILVGNVPLAGDILDAQYIFYDPDKTIRESALKGTVSLEAEGCGVYDFVVDKKNVSVYSRISLAEDNCTVKSCVFNNCGPQTIVFGADVYSTDIDDNLFVAYSDNSTTYPIVIAHPGMEFDLKNLLLQNCRIDPSSERDLTGGVVPAPVVPRAYEAPIVFMRCEDYPQLVNIQCNVAYLYDIGERINMPEGLKSLRSSTRSTDGNIYKLRYIDMVDPSRRNLEGVLGAILVNGSPVVPRASASSRAMFARTSEGGELVWGDKLEVHELGYDELGDVSGFRSYLPSRRIAEAKPLWNLYH